MPQLEGRIALVMGAAATRSLAVGLAAQGATVVVTMRDERAVTRLAGDISAQTGNPRVHGLVVDLTSLASVRLATVEFIGRFRRLHLLVTTPRANLGPFLLAHLLLDTMKQSGRGQVVRLRTGARHQIWAAT